MTDLTFVNPADITPAFSIMLYGPPGTGKTIAALSAPGPVLYVNADRAHAASKARAVHGADQVHELWFESVDQLDEVYLRMRSGTAPEQTVALDTVGEVYDKLLQEASKNNTGKSAGLVTLENHGYVQTKIVRFIEAMNDLPINLVLICHEQVDDQEAELTRRPMTGGRKLPEKLMGKVDIVAYTAAVTDEETDVTRWVGQLVEGHGRRAKDGTGGLGKVRDLNLSEWIKTGAAALATVDPKSTNNKNTKELKAA